MTLHVVFRRAAKTEFEDAAIRDEEQRHGLGEEFIVEIEQAVARAAPAPERYPWFSATCAAPSRGAFRIPCTSGSAVIPCSSSPYSTAAGILPSGSGGHEAKDRGRAREPERRARPF